MFTLCKQRDQPRVRSRRESSSSQTDVSAHLKMFGEREPTTCLRGTPRVHVTGHQTGSGCIQEVEMFRDAARVN